MHHPAIPHAGASRRMRLATALALGALTIGSLGVARADTKASIKCRKTLSIQLSKLANAGFKNADKCHKAADKICTVGSNRAACNDVMTAGFDPKAKYSDGKAKATQKIDKDCLAGDPVLANYNGGNIENAVLPLIDQAVESNSSLTQGDADLLCDKPKVKCLEAIGKGRSKIMKEILKSSVKCQKNLDKTAVSFGPIDPGCIGAGDKSVPKALADLAKKCTDAGVDPATVGTCSPFPGCVTSDAIATGQILARDIFSVSCGDGVVDPGEQCDDGNLMDGDGCNGLCELEGRTCTDFGSSILGTRTVKVSINTPTALSGVQVAFDYPQFEAGIPGVGTSSLVADRLTVLQSADLSGINDTDTDGNVALVKLNGGFTTGDLFSVTLDNCVALSHRICNRAQNVIDCCSDMMDPNQFVIPPGSETCPKKECLSKKTCYLGSDDGMPCTDDNDCGQSCNGGVNANMVCTMDSDCPGGRCQGLCGQAICMTDADCDAVAGDCQPITCGVDPDVCIGAGRDGSPQFGACAFKCDGNPPVCAPGHFGPTKCVGGANDGMSCSVDSDCPGGECNPTVGTCDNVAGACPGDNQCVDQTNAHTCNISSPVDADGQPVDGVTCTLTITETP